MKPSSLSNPTPSQIDLMIKDRKVTKGRVSLAAYLGHESAREFLGEKAPPEEEDLFRWLRGLARWGANPCVLASVTLAELVQPALRDASGQDADLAQAAISATKAWLSDPSPENQAVAAELEDPFDTEDAPGASSRRPEVFAAIYAAMFASVSTRSAAAVADVGESAADCIRQSEHLREIHGVSGQPAAIHALVRETVRNAVLSTVFPAPDRDG